MDKFHALIKKMVFIVNYQIKSYKDSTHQHSFFRSNLISMVGLQADGSLVVKGKLPPRSGTNLEAVEPPFMKMGHKVLTFLANIR